MKKLFVICYLLFVGSVFGQSDTTLQADTVRVGNAYVSDLTSGINGLQAKGLSGWGRFNAAEYILRDVNDTLGSLRLYGVFTSGRELLFPDASGTVAYNNPLYGGLGLNQIPSEGQIPIGTGTGYSLATLKGDENISVVNTSGEVQIDMALSPSFYNPTFTNGFIVGSIGDASIMRSPLWIQNPYGNLQLDYLGANKLLYTDASNIVQGKTIWTVADGGTGATTLTGLLIGNGTSAFTATTVSSGISGQITDETGSGALVFGTSPTFTTSVTVPTVYGSSAANGDITIEGTSDATKTTSYIGLQPNGGKVGIGTASPVDMLEIQLPAATNDGLVIDAATNYNPAVRFFENGTSKWTFEYNSNSNVGTRTNNTLEVLVSGTNTAAMIFRDVSGYANIPQRLRVGDTVSATVVLDVTSGDNTTASVMRINAASASITTSDRFIDFQNSSSTSIGDISGTAVSGVIAYNTFTGGHYAQLQNEAETFEIGMLVSSTGQIMENTVQLPLITKSEGRADKRVYGVYAGKIAEGAAQSEVDSFLTIKARREGKKNRKPVKNLLDSLNRIAEDSLDEIIERRFDEKKIGKSYSYAKGNGHKDLHQVLALGTGVLLVTDTNGDIANGDLICSSPIAGLGEKQTDDIVRSSTVAKATEGVVWAKEKVKKKLIAVTYK